MASYRRNHQTSTKDNIEELINEASEELGVDLHTRSINENPKKLAERIKQLIRKRTR